MKRRRSCWVFLPVIIVASVALAGCTSRLQPSAQERQAAVNEAHAVLRGHWPAIASAIFITFGSDAPFAPQVTQVDSKVLYTGFPEANTSGVAAAITADGYLITDQHILRPHMWVLGKIDGTIQFREARVVHAQTFDEFGGEFALLHIAEAALPHFELGVVTPELDLVIAVGTQRDERLDIEPIAGRITVPARPPAANHVAILRSDLRLSFGDSGGPLLTPGGQLIAVNNSSVMPWLTLKVTALSCAPDPAMIRRLIDEDRQRQTLAPPRL